MVTLSGLKEDTRYYVALTAYGTDGNESNYFDDVCVQVADSAIDLCSASSSGGGGGSAGCFISAAGLQTAYPISGAFFPSRSAYILFSFSAFILLIIISARSILLKIRFKVQG